MKSNKQETGVAVIGAGFGGIASALRLRKKGYEVELIDRCNNLGGRAQVFNRNGFKAKAKKSITYKLIKNKGLIYVEFKKVNISSSKIRNF